MYNTVRDFHLPPLTSVITVLLKKIEVYNWNTGVWRLHLEFSSGAKGINEIWSSYGTACDCGFMDMKMEAAEPSRMLYFR